MNSVRDYDHKLKVLMLGDTAVGKTCLLKRYCNEKFFANESSTCGIDMRIKKLEIDGLRVRLHCWDTVGQERFRSICRSYYHGAEGVVLVYDITNEQSFKNCTRWAQEISRDVGKDIGVVLVGNKADREDAARQIDSSEGKALGEAMHAEFFESSAKTAFNVSEAFDMIARAVLSRHLTKACSCAPRMQPVGDAEGSYTPLPKQKKTGCCSTGG